jgi:hypothetical protein
MAVTINASTSAGLVQTADTSGILQLQTANTTAVTVDASQNVGIGTASPADSLQISKATFPTLRLTETTVNNNFILQYHSGSAVSFITNTAAYPIVFKTIDTERMRIDTVGRVGIGTATSSIRGGLEALSVDATVAGGGDGISTKVSNAAGLIIRKTAFNTNNFVQLFENGSGTQIGSITQSGATTTAYNGSSDYRLKKDIKPMTNALEKVLLLKPCTFTWTQDNKEDNGFIAHELQEILPNVVTGKKDAIDDKGNPVYQGIDPRLIVATLTAAIQEQQTIITNLTARVTALEAK